MGVTSVLAHLLISHAIISATRGKLGVLKFSIEMSRGYPNALIISVKSIQNRDNLNVVSFYSKHSLLKSL